MNVLVLTPFLPCLGKHGGSAQMYNLWSHVQNLENMYVHILSHQTDMEEGGSKEALQTFKHIDIIRIGWPEHWRLQGYMPENQHHKKRPPFLSETYIKQLIKLLQEEGWDTVVIEMQFMMHFSKIIKNYIDCPVGLVVHESMEYRYKDDPEMLSDLIAYQNEFERYIDFYVCFSEEDKRSVSSQGKAVYTLPLCVNVENVYSARRIPGDVIFLGSYSHQPNVDAVDYLLNDIMPLVKSPYRLKLCGAQLTDALKMRWKNYPNVELIGFVDDANMAMAESQLMVAPIISGKGVRTKIVEALSQNTPVITTSLGKEGIDVIDGEDILIADTSEEFAKKIDSVLQNRVSVGGNAKSKVDRHNPINVAKQMYALLLSVEVGE